MNTDNNVIVTPDKLKRLFSFKNNIDGVKVKKEFQIGNNAVMLICVLSYTKSKRTQTVPVIYYEGKDYILAPMGKKPYPKTPEEIPSVTWRVNDTDVEAVMLNGLPVLPPGTPDPVSDAINATRQYIGSTIRTARENAGLTLRDLAERCEMRFSHLARIERGRNGSNIDTIATIFNALGLKLVILKKN